MTLRNLYNANSRAGTRRLAANGRRGVGPQRAHFGPGHGGIPVGEYTSLRNFSRELGEGNITGAQARARAALYTEKRIQRFWAEDQLMQTKWGKTEELWEDTQGPNECAVCPELAAMGWVPIGAHGTVPGAGATLSWKLCLCNFLP